MKEWGREGPLTGGGWEGPLTGGPLSRMSKSQCPRVAYFAISISVLK